MDGSEKSSGSWWQTVPGILTAIAGIITAVAGLLVVLHQIGLLGNKEKPASSPPLANSDSGKRSEAMAPLPTPANSTEPSKAAATSVAAKALGNDRAKSYALSFPSGTEVTLHSNRADGIYKILAAQVDNRHTGKLGLKLSVRLTNMGRSDLGFGSDTFRLLVDGVPRAPTNFLNQLVDARSAKEGDVVFDLPESAESLILSVANGEDSANIPLALKKAD